MADISSPPGCFFFYINCCKGIGILREYLYHSAKLDDHIIHWVVIFVRDS